MQIGNDEVAKLMVGTNVIYRKSDPETLWYQTISGNQTTEFGGTLLMNYDPESGLATFRGTNFLQTKTKITGALFITLPAGFVFDTKKSPTTMPMYNQILANNVGKYTGNLTYDGNKCFVDVSILADNYNGVYATPWVDKESFGYWMKFYVKRSD